MGGGATTGVGCGGASGRARLPSPAAVEVVLRWRRREHGHAGALGVGVASAVTMTLYARTRRGAQRRGRRCRARLGAARRDGRCSRRRLPHDVGACVARERLRVGEVEHGQTTAPAALARLDSKPTGRAGRERAQADVQTVCLHVGARGRVAQRRRRAGHARRQKHRRRAAGQHEETRAQDGAHACVENRIALVHNKERTNLSGVSPRERVRDYHRRCEKQIFSSTVARGRKSVERFRPHSEEAWRQDINPVSKPLYFELTERLFNIEVTERLRLRSGLGEITAGRSACGTRWR